MKVEGITWHAAVLEEPAFAAAKKLYIETFGLEPMMEMDGVAVFQMENGSLLELCQPQAVPPYGYNDSLAFGFRVHEIEQASAAIAAADGELLGEITRVGEIGYAYRHFKVRTAASTASANRSRDLRGGLPARSALHPPRSCRAAGLSTPAPDAHEAGGPVSGQGMRLEPSS